MVCSSQVKLQQAPAGAGLGTRTMLVALRQQGNAPWVHIPWLQLLPVTAKHAMLLCMCCAPPGFDFLCIAKLGWTCCCRCYCHGRQPGSLLLLRRRLLWPGDATLGGRRCGLQLMRLLFFC
jgi:hypothetical protein